MKALAVSVIYVGRFGGEWIASWCLNHCLLIRLVLDAEDVQL